MAHKCGPPTLRGPAGSGSYFFFQEDGDLVVYDGRSSGTAVWNSGTGGQGGQKLRITENGFLALYGISGQLIWKSCPHTLLVNQMLHSGYSMSSSNGNYKLSMQGDGDLVLYDISNGHNVVNWRTGPSKLKFDTYAMLQSDGNLVLRDQVHLLQWETMTAGSGATSLVLQDDGKLVLCCKEDGSAIWTNAPPNQGIFGIKANGFKANVIKPFGLGLEPLVNMNLGVKSQRRWSEAMKHPKHTSQLMNFGEMKSEVLGENSESVRNSWSVWSDFTACSGTCGPATKMRERACTDPANPEITCEGPTAQIYNCDLPSCAEAGGWSAWSDVNACSATCGSATKTRKRTCNDLNGGLTCLGSSEETIDCNLDDCGEAHDILVVDGGWSAWSDLTTCSASCGRATKMRVRTCSDPEPINGGLMCQGLTEEIQDCNLDDCLVIRGGWSAWSHLGACTATCGSATKKMARTCTNPEPSDESLTCQGPKVIILDCELPNCPIIMDCGFPSCPIDGGWSTWSDFSSCTASCGPATKRRERICGNPVPANGGLDCSGLSKETLNCDLLNCAIFG